MSKNKDEKTLADSMSFLKDKDFFKKKENLYVSKVFVLSFILLFVIRCFFTTTDMTISYFLSLISSVMIINGYNEVKKGNGQ